MSPEPRLIRQVCAIPYRRRGDQVEFCIITSLENKRWIFPKGIIDPGETYAQTALKETLEEAGLRGSIVGEPLGEYQDAKWGAQLTVLVVLMEVSRCDQEWQESQFRQRRWVSRDEAREMLSRSEHKRFLEAAAAQL